MGLLGGPARGGGGESLVPAQSLYPLGWHQKHGAGTWAKWAKTVGYLSTSFPPGAQVFCPGLMVWEG